MLNKQELVAAMAKIHRLFNAIPYWDNTAKLHGKVVRVEELARQWDEHADLQALLEDLKALEHAVRRLHDQDPLTRLLQHVIDCREAVERFTSESPPVTARHLQDQQFGSSQAAV